MVTINKIKTFYDKTTLLTTWFHPDIEVILGRKNFSCPCIIMKQFLSSDFEFQLPVFWVSTFNFSCKTPSEHLNLPLPSIPDWNPLKIWAISNVKFTFSACSHNVSWSSNLNLFRLPTNVNQMYDFQYYVWFSHSFMCSAISDLLELNCIVLLFGIKSFHLPFISAQTQKTRHLLRPTLLS